MEKSYCGGSCIDSQMHVERESRDRERYNRPIAALPTKQEERKKRGQGRNGDKDEGERVESGASSARSAALICVYPSLPPYFPQPTMFHFSTSYFTMQILFIYTSTMYYLLPMCCILKYWICFSHIYLHTLHAPTPIPVCHSRGSVCTI